jgi:hypothetical protein
MPLQEKAGTHYAVRCDSCRYSNVEVCAKRDSGAEGKRIAVEKLRNAGWHVDGLGSPREKWFCPGCARKPHL